MPSTVLATLVDNHVYSDPYFNISLEYKELRKHIEVAGELATLIRSWGAIQ